MMDIFSFFFQTTIKAVITLATKDVIKYIYQREYVNEINERMIFLLPTLFLMETRSSTMICVNPSLPSKV